jgi:hypothetical protein
MWKWGLFLIAAALAAQTQTVDGEWNAMIDPTGQRLHLGLHVITGKDGAMSGALDSPDQNANGMQLTSITLTGATLKFTLDSVGGSYEGVVKGDKIAGNWTQGGNTLPLEWSRGKAHPETEKVERLSEKTAKEQGRLYTTWFYDEKKNADLWAKLGPKMQKVLGDGGKLKDLRQQIADQAGAETKVVEETISPMGALQVYRRVAQFEKVPDGLELQMGFDAKGLVDIFMIRPVQK